MVDAVGEPRHVGTNIFCEVAVFGVDLDVADLRPNRTHLASDALGDVLLQIQAQVDQRLSDLGHRIGRWHCSSS
jgi:hypothetical protein